jgi:Rieske Fe-S protein
VDPHGGHGTPHEPTPTIWPVGFAIGIACIFIGLILSPIIVAVGAVLAAIFGFLWIRDVTRGIRTVSEEPVEEPEPAPRAPGIQARATPEPGEGEIIRYPRSKFLEASTLGLGALIGVVVTAPVLGFTVLPPFIKQGHPKVDVGALEDFLDDVPSFTILSNRCVHLGCPVQVNGLPIDDDAQTEVNEGQRVTRIPTAAAAGFGCPCHGGQYDNEGNRTAGPPVRALDRYEFEINNGRLLLGDTYSVSEVDGTGAEAQIHAYPLLGPGQHVDGPEGLLYPVEPPN